MVTSRRKKMPTPGKAPTYPDVPALSKSPGTMDMTPGFYQGRQYGLKSGRVSPRDAIRPSRSDSVDAAHGIVSSGSIDPHQGQLFNTKQMPSIPHDELVRRAGGAPADPGANHKGFMPGLTSHKQKIAAVKRLDAARERTGASRGGPPVKEAMEDRASSLGRSHERDWYASRNEHGHIAPGDAGNLIEDVASRTGVSQSRATRAVAITSPRTSWAIDNDPTGGHSGGQTRPNINSAEQVIEAVKGLGADPSAIRVERAAGDTPGRALDKNKIKAGREFAKGEPRANIPISGPSSVKVPNFEQSLQQDHASKAVQAQAARSYTVDVHDTSVVGGDEAMLKTAGGYHIAAMTGRRASLAARQLPTRGQSMMWEAQRGTTTPDSLGTQGLFITARGNRMIPNPAANADMRISRAHNADLRSPTAMKHGLEF